MSQQSARPGALVTGGRRGIGRGIAWALASSGFNVAILDLDEDDAATETLDGIAQRGGHGVFVRADIGALAGHEAAIERAWSALGGVECLANNAGISVRKRGDMLEVGAEDFDHVMGINLRGPFFLTQAVAKRMLAVRAPRGPRTIINISSFNALAVAIDRSEYCLAKTGVSMMTRLFAARLAPHNITVNEIRPGIIRTGMTAVAQEKYDRLIESGGVPMPRWGEPADIGKAAAAIATGAFAFTTGDAFHIDGGLHILRL
jgi:NAD(P)-dependent dehydrogenase (short-subunit alcohol dehydrogenase family)